MFLTLRVSWFSLHKYSAIAVGFIISASSLCFCSWLAYHFRSAIFQLFDYHIPGLHTSLFSSAKAIHLFGSYTLYGLLIGLPHESGL
jgi:hypothetical protein